MFAYLNVSDITPRDPGLELRKKSEEYLNSLKVSIQTMGLINPIMVRPISSDKYQLISGQRRLKCLQQLGWIKIAAQIMTAEEEQNLVKYMDL